MPLVSVSKVLVPAVAVLMSPVPPAYLIIWRTTAVCSAEPKLTKVLPERSLGVLMSVRDASAHQRATGFCVRSNTNFRSAPCELNAATLLSVVKPTLATPFSTLVSAPAWAVGRIFTLTPASL